MISLDQFRDFLQLIPYPCVTVYEHSRIVLSNPHAEQLFGYTSEELAGRLIDTLIPDLFRDVHIGQANKRLPNRKINLIDEGLELTAFHSNGSTLPVEVNLSPVVMNGDRFFLAIIRDITRHRQDEERLRQSQAQLRELSARLLSLGEEEMDH